MGDGEYVPVRTRGVKLLAATVAGGNMCTKRRESKEGKGDMNKEQ